MDVPTVKSEHNTHTDFGPAKRLVNGSTNLLTDAVVAVSEAVAESFDPWEDVLLSKAGVEKLVIDNGVDVGAVQRAADRDVPVSLPEGFLVGGGGRMVPQKNLSTLVEAVDRARSTRPDLTLVLTGDGPRRDALESLAEDRGITDRVLFTGYLPERADVHALFHRLDAFAFPSKYEGWGVAAGEAMAAGLPVVAGDVPALRDVVGEAGVLVDPGDADALATHLVELAGDPERRRELGTAGRRRIGEHYSIERTVEDHLALYQRLATGAE
jgi:glycosyltransferase involved in cell wall biosynthesis